MKFFPPLPISICLASLSFCAVAQAQEKPLIDLTFNAAAVGKPPATASFDLSSVNHSVESIAVTDTNKLEVVNGAPDLVGPALRFTKGSEEPRTPKTVLVNSPGLVKSGKVRFTWEAKLNSFEASAKFPGHEALLTLVLSDATGKPFYTLSYLVGPDKTSGFFGSLGQKIGSWTVGKKQQIELLIDLDAGTASVKIDGASAGDDQKITTTDELRVVQFTDGAGLAYYGSKFTATVAHFKMTVP